MTGPSWLADGFAGLMLLTAGYCAGRLVAARVQRRPAERDVDLVHVLMGVAMAGMLVPRIGLRPAGLCTGIWAVVFAAAAGWFAWRAGLAWWLARRPGPPAGHHLPHLIMSGTMVYMLLAAGPAAGSAPGAAMGGAGTRFPLLAIAAAQFMAGYVLWAADRLPALAPVRDWRPAALPAAAPATAPRPPLSPRLAACCNIAMGVALGYLLVMAR